MIQKHENYTDALSIIYNTDEGYIIMYHKVRNLWKIYTKDEKSNWLKSLASCFKTKHDTDSSFLIQHLRRYFRRKDNRYIIFGSKTDNISEIDIKLEFPEDFI